MYVAALPTCARFRDVAGPIDLMMILWPARRSPAHIREAAAKRAKAVWRPLGTWSRAAGEEAQSLSSIRPCAFIAPQPTRGPHSQWDPNTSGRQQQWLFEPHHLPRAIRIDDRDGRQAGRGMLDENLFGMANQVIRAVERHIK